MSNKSNFANDMFDFVISDKLPKDFSNEVYHYTDSNAAESIIKNKVFYATNTNDLEDKTERDHIYQVYKKVINNLAKEDSFYKKFINVNKVNYYNDFFYNKSLNCFDSRVIQNTEVFIVCLSKSCNSIYMKEHYGKNGKKLEFTTLNTLQQISNCNIEVKDVIYDDKDKEKIIIELLQAIKNDCIDDSNYLLAKEIIESWLFNYRDIFKKQEYENENERRIIIAQDKFNPAFEVKTRQKNNKTIKYIEFPYEDYLFYVETNNEI